MHNSLNLESKHVTKTNKKDDANREVGTPVGSYPSSFWQIRGGGGQVMPATLLLSPNPLQKKFWTLRRLWTQCRTIIFIRLHRAPAQGPVKILKADKC